MADALAMLKAALEALSDPERAFHQHIDPKRPDMGGEVLARAEFARHALAYVQDPRTREAHERGWEFTEDRGWVRDE